MRLADFESMVRRMAGAVPAEYLDGIAEIVVSPHTLPHPTRGDIYTLGECIPIPGVDGEGHIQSRVVLYHGSFRALAGLDPEFDWREETWETLTHEVQHHLEWRANADRLDALDRAAEANFARQDGEPFDPLFFLDGEPLAEGVYRVEHDHFIDRQVNARPDRVGFGWHGRSYQLEVPATATLPALLTVTGVEEPPPGDLVLVLRRRPGIRDLFRRPRVSTWEVEARPTTAEH